jgi:hypothetical protein
LHSLVLLSSERDFGFPRGAQGLEAVHGGGLPIRVDLDERLARPDPVTRAHEDLRDEALGLRLNGRRTQGSHHGHEFGALGDGLLSERDRLDGRRGEPATTRGTFRATATRGAEDRHDQNCQTLSHPKNSVADAL